MKKYISLVYLALAASACSTAMPACPQKAQGDVIYVVGQGWHTEIGIPVSELGKDFSFYRKTFPGAKVIMFGYGKKTFVTAPPETFSEYLLGPVPGPAVIHVVGLSVTPVEAYPPDATVTLAISPSGRKALSEFLWHDLLKDDAEKPRVVAHSTNPDGLFYAAISEYSLLHTCNTWTVDALHAAGIDVQSDGVIFSNQAMDQINDTASMQCQAR